MLEKPEGPNSQSRRHRAGPRHQWRYSNRVQALRDCSRLKACLPTRSLRTFGTGLERWGKSNQLFFFAVGVDIDAGVDREPISSICRHPGQLTTPTAGTPGTVFSGGFLGRIPKGNHTDGRGSRRSFRPQNGLGSKFVGWAAAAKTPAEGDRPPIRPGPGGKWRFAAPGSRAAGNWSPNPAATWEGPWVSAPRPKLHHGRRTDQHHGPRRRFARLIKEAAIFAEQPATGRGPANRSEWGRQRARNRLSLSSPNGHFRN